MLGGELVVNVMGAQVTESSIILWVVLSTQPNQSN